jgi:hypothetical protein
MIGDTAKHPSEQPMLRFSIALVFAITVCGTAASADRALPRRSWHRTTVMLPAGLPRPHYNFRTTITYAEPYARPLYIRETPVVVAAPSYAIVPYAEPLLDLPMLPYGDPHVPYWGRLPYACGVYGYC